ncbi:MAG: hypothetical protein H6738_06560 [Alphaproteobacteria bacterium]|nr:hypothetical protein [Alphaproteobacteria bacterium]MCB9696423.1 hypothetical protein [Alphaproteobacteria bacterium]
MSQEQKRGDSVPPEARRRGGMDTLFSAPWFDEEAAANLEPATEEAPKKKSNTLLIVVVVAVILLVPIGLCGLSVVGAAGWWFYTTQGF